MGTHEDRLPRQVVQAGKYDRSRQPWPAIDWPKWPIQEPMAGTIPIRRILLVRPSALGDVCRTVPVLASLRARWPEAEIHWVVQSGFADAIRSHPALSGVVTFPREAFRGAALRPWRWPAIVRWLASLRRGRWDLAIDCQGLGRTGMMLWASGARVRVGDRHARECAWLACTTRVRPERDLHEVDRMLALSEAAGAPIVADPTLHVDSTHGDWWSHQRLPGRYAVLATTSRWPSKAWPQDRWVELATRLTRQGHVQWIALPGSEAERAQVTACADAMTLAGVTVVNLAGRTSIGQVMVVIEGGAVTVSNDSAALHMAVGLGGRCVGLYGPTDPARVGPWGLSHRVVRAPLDDGERPAFKKRALGDTIMRRIEVGPVYDMAVQVITADNP